MAARAACTMRNFGPLLAPTIPRAFQTAAMPVRCLENRIVTRITLMDGWIMHAQAIQLEVENEEKEHAAQYDPQLPSE